MESYNIWPLRLTSLTQHNIFEVHPLWHVSVLYPFLELNDIPFMGIEHTVVLPQMIFYPFLHLIVFCPAFSSQPSDNTSSGNSPKIPAQRRSYALRGSAFFPAQLLSPAAIKYSFGGYLVSGHPLSQNLRSIGQGILSCYLYYFHHVSLTSIRGPGI